MIAREGRARPRRRWRGADTGVQQETQIEGLQADIKKLQGTEHNQRQEYEAFLQALDVE
jgi:hypothetical protein